MNDKMIEQIEADRDAGTLGPWTDDEKTHDQPYLPIKIGKKFHTVCTIWIDDAPVEDFNSEQKVNARRIARVPDMEARIRADAEVIKAAEALAEAVTREREMPCQDMDMQLREIQAVDEALAAFRQAQACAAREVE